jgi:hypothetical protein
LIVGAVQEERSNKTGNAIAMPAGLGNDGGAGLSFPFTRAAIPNRLFVGRLCGMIVMLPYGHVALPYSKHFWGQVRASRYSLIVAREPFRERPTETALTIPVSLTSNMELAMPDAQAITAYGYFVVHCRGGRDAVPA